MIQHFMKNHRDVLEVIVAAGSGFSLLMTNIDFVLRVLIGCASLGFILYKWRCYYVDRKNKKK